MNLKKKAVLARLERLEDAIAKGNEYLNSGANSEWYGFRALFTVKSRDGKVLPPHRDWVKNVFLPSKQRALEYAHRILEKFN